MTLKCSVLLVTLAILCTYVFTSQASAQDAAEPTKNASAVGVKSAAEAPEDTQPFPYFVERIVGQAQHPVVFNWRKSQAAVSFEAGPLLELNNFESSRFAGLFRFPSDGASWQIGVASVRTRSTESTELVGRTPYRQTGRPSRWEFDMGADMAFSEGALTHRFSFLPSIEMVFSLQGRLRYLYYPGSAEGLDWAARAKTLIQSQFTSKELENIQAKRLAGMNVDPNRINTLFGTRLDLYTKQGVVLSQNVLMNAPLLGSGTGLRYWFDLSLGVGYAF